MKKFIKEKQNTTFLLKNNEMINLKNLVAINSFQNTDKIINFLTQKFKPYAEEMIILKNKENQNKSIIIGLNTKLKDINPIVLAGHIDTVSPNTNLYKTNPLNLTVIDNKAYGLGSIDMKSFTAIILDNCEKIKKITYPIVISLTTDEETDLICIENVIQKFKDLNILPKFSIIGEPTKCEINNQANGCLEFEVIVRGKSCHSSVIKEGINSINIMAKLISYIEELQLNIKGLTSNCGVIEGGDIVNRVPEICKLKFDVRSSQKKTIDDFLNNINSKINQLQNEYPGSNIILNKTLEIPPLEDTNSKIIAEISNDLKLNISKFPAGCEAGYYKALSGESIIFGVGDINLAHKPNEYVKINEYLEYSALLINLINKIIDIYNKN